MDYPVPYGNFWLAIHAGLLDDERMHQLPPAVRGAWLWLFLSLDREPNRGWFKDIDRPVWLLCRAGWTDRAARKSCATMFSVGWLVASEDGRVTLRNWSEYQLRGKKAVYNKNRGDRSEENAKRPTTRAGRQSRTARDMWRIRGGAVEEPEKKPTPSVSSGAAARVRETAAGPNNGEIVSFAERVGPVEAILGPRPSKRRDGKP